MRPNTHRRVAIASTIAIFCFAVAAQAQVVTARFVSSDPLDNPAAATFRTKEGAFVKANRDEDRTNALNLVKSSLGIETVTNVFQGAFLFQESYFFGELNVGFQNGTKVTSSTDTSGELTVENQSSTNTDSISLMPLQLITAFRFGTSGRLGLKVIHTIASSDTKNDFAFSRTETEEYGRTKTNVTSVNETNKQNNQYTTVGLGGVINLFGSGFDLGIGADYMMLAIDQKVDGSARTVTYAGNVTETATNSDIKRNVSVLKELYGLSYRYTSTTYSFRAEANYQKMPPLDVGSTLKIGELTRGMVEAIWTSFYGGVEVASKRGYFIDPNNLVPIYFNFAHLTGDSAVSYGFFAGFKLSAGNSFGASYYESNEEKEEQLSISDPTRYKIERKTRSFGISYSYVF